MGLNKKDVVYSYQINYDKGKFKAGVKVEIIKKKVNGKLVVAGFKFRPFLKVIEGFKNSHRVMFWWSDRYNNYNADGVNTGKEHNLRYKLKNDVKSKGIYYIDAYKGSSAMAKSGKKLKKTKKKPKITKKSKYADSWVNYDNYVMIYCQVGHSAIAKVKVSYRDNGVLSQPVFDKDTWKRVSDTRFEVNGHGLGSFEHPIRKVVLRRKDNHTNADWSDVGGSGGTLSIAFPGDINKTAIKTFVDNTITPGNRYAYQLVAYDDAGRHRSTELELTKRRDKLKKHPRPNDGKIGNWIYTTPPKIDNLEHRRVNDTQNIITITRDPQHITNGIYHHFRLEYSTDNGVTWTRFTDEQMYTGKKPKDSKKILKTDVAVYDNGTTQVAADWVNSNKNATMITTAVLYHETKPDTSYRYRVFPVTIDYNGADLPSDVAAPSYLGSEITYNTPAEPIKVEAVMREDGYIELTIHKTKTSTANIFYVERQTDGGDWEYADATSGDQGVTIVDTTKPTLTYVDKTLIAGTKIKYRVSFANTTNFPQPTVGDGMSKPTESDEVLMLSKPNPPVPVMPFNGAVVMDDAKEVQLGWVHSPNDGTSQTKANLQYRVNGDEWLPLLHNTESYTKAYFDLTDTNSLWKANDIIEWRVRTKGAHEEFSNWSDISSFKIFKKPEIKLTAPANQQTIKNLPLKLEWDYTDLSGEMASLFLDIIQDNEVLETYDLSTAQSGEEFSDYVFDTGETYTLRLRATSTTNTSCSSSASVIIAYEKCYFAGMMAIASQFEETTGYAKCILTPDEGNTQEDIDGMNNGLIVEKLEAITPEERATISDTIKDEVTLELVEALPAETLDKLLTKDEKYKFIDTTTKTVYVYRVHDSDKVLVYKLDCYDENGEYKNSSAVEFTDKYVPLNVDYRYELLMIGQNGSICDTTVVQHQHTIWWYCYYGADGIAKARWNPTGTVNLTRPEKQMVRYSGRSYPVTYDSNAREETMSFSCKVYDDQHFLQTDYPDENGMDTIGNFRDMMESGGRGVWKSFEGDVYPAVFNFSYQSDYTDRVRSWGLSLNVTRIDEGFDYDIE